MNNSQEPDEPYEDESTRPIPIPPPVPAFDLSKIRVGQITASGIAYGRMEQIECVPSTDEYADTRGYVGESKRSRKPRRATVWVLTAIIAALLIGGAVLAFHAVTTLQSRDEAISALKATTANQAEVIEELDTDLTDVRDTLERSQAYADSCEAQAEAYWLSAVALGDAFIAYLDTYPYGTIDLSEAEDYRDEGDGYLCYIR